MTQNLQMIYLFGSNFKLFTKTAFASLNGGKLKFLYNMLWN